MKTPVMITISLSIPQKQS